MRITVPIVAALLFAAPCFGQPAMSVDVYVSGRDDSQWFLRPGESVAAAIFRKIGVRVNWRHGDRPPGVRALSVRTADRAPASASLAALAATHLLGTEGAEITVYADRLKSLIEEHPNWENVALAYVLAHEMAHGIEGVARHSDCGILKAIWSRDDWNLMAMLKLNFKQSDVEWIRGRLLDPDWNEPGAGRPAVDSCCRSARPNTSSGPAAFR